MVAPPQERLPLHPHRYHDEQTLLRLRGLQYCTQQPGTAVILPDGYWHATYQKGPWSLAIGGQGLVSDVLYDVKIENFSSPALLGLADAVVPIGLPGEEEPLPGEKEPLLGEEDPWPGEEDSRPEEKESFPM